MNSGFSAFGTGSGFNSTNTNLFSSNTSNTLRPSGTGSIFGSTSAQQTGLGTPSQPQSSGLFSSSFNSFAGGAQGQQAVGTTIKFSAPSGTDSINKNGTTTQISTNHQCITAMKEYESKSLEELRFEDYQANRKYATASSQFGTSSGLFSSSTASTGFGGTNLFGSGAQQQQQQQQQQQANRPLLFGSTTGTTGASTAPSTGLFGSTAQTSTNNRSFFGSSTTGTTGTTAGFSGFGTQPTTSVFGSQPAQTTQTTGIFGNIAQPTTTTPSGSIFGSTTATTSGGSIFGSQANKPLGFGGFGQQSTTLPTQPTTTSPFSFTSASTQPAATGQSIFGAQATTQSPLSTAKPFGSTGFGSGLSSSLSTGFGSTPAATGTTTGIFGTLSSPANQAKPAFGTNTGTTTGFGGFSSTSTTTTPSQGTTGSIFGGFGSGTQQAQQTTGLNLGSSTPFGSTLGGAQPTTGLGGTTFGSTTGSSIFGSTQTQAQPAGTATGGGLFGSQTSTGFGSPVTGFGNTGLGNTGLGGQTTTTPGTGIFGATATQQNSSFGGLGLGTTTSQPGSSFLSGTTGTTGGGGLFGSSLTGSTFGTGTTGSGLGLGGGLSFTQQTQPQLGMSQLQAQQAQDQVQQQLAALSNSPYGSHLLRNTLQDLGKKEDIFKPLSPIAQRPYITEATSPVKVTPIVPTSVSDIKGGLSQTLKLTPKPLHPISLNKKSNDLFEGLDEEEAPCFVPRKNIKKLLFRPSSNTSLGLDINTSRRSSANSSVNGDQKVDFMGRKSGVADESLRYNTDQNNDYKSNFMLGQITADLTNVSDDGGAGVDNQSEISTNHVPNPANVVLERPGYFIIPAIQELEKYVDSKGDCIVDNFAIGRVDYGCITFPGETNIANMNLDEIVHIRRKEVHVYPDDSKKPLVGQGLNKPAEITLHRIWPTDKETKKAITDPNRIINMGYNKKLEKVTDDMGAQFIDYDPSTGSWTFKVKHFSKYGFHDSDDEDDDKPAKTNLQIRPIKPIYAEATSTAAVVATASADVEFKQEKDMIQKQLKLIEARRLELSKQAKYSNALKNQQWEMLNEYTIPTVPAPTTNKISAAHLDLSSDSQDIVNEDYLEDDEDKHSMHSNVDQLKKTSQQVQSQMRKQEDHHVVEDLNEDEDNKENSLYPSLKSLQAKNNASKPDKIYPNLNSFEPTSADGFKYSSEAFAKNNLELDNKEYLKGFSSEMIITEDQYRTSDLPFVISSNERMLANTRSNRGLMKAFFNDDVDELSMNEEDNKVRLSNLMQKPLQQQAHSAQLGHVRKGLGGISNEELFEKKLSLKKDSPYFAGQQQKKLKNITTMILNLADIQHRIDSKALKPKLWNRYLLQKTLKLGIQKGTDEQHVARQDQYDLDDGELAKNEYSRMQQMQPTRISSEITAKSLSNIPFSKYTNSITFNKQTFLADVALLHSHEFRINWSMCPTSTTYINLDLNMPQTSMNMLKLLSPSTVTTTQLNDPEKLAIIQENCVRYLDIQLDLSEFVETTKLNYFNSHKLPLLRSKSGNDLIRNFFECTEEIRNKIGDHPDADNIEHMKYVWSLCQNLWGDIPDTYKIDPTGYSMSQYEQEQIRKRLLSEWLAEKKENYLDSMFCLLTGNRLLEACKMASDNLDYRLALMMSQSPGGSKTFRDMITKQINEWLMSGSEKFLNADRLKFYVLLSGNLVLNSPSNDEQLINTCENLDWKRQLGLHLWYKCLPVNSIHDALSYYEKSLCENICVKPLPPYLEDKVLTNPNETISYQQNIPALPTNFQQSTLFRQFNQNKKQLQREIYDTCYHLIRLYCDENYSVADTIAPLAHNSNQLDFRLSWHLAMALVSLNFKYISKESLENLHDSYASQLQSIGLWHWSVFILMHIQNDQEREKFVRNYISRYVSGDSELNEKESFLIEKLKVPAEWVYDYKANRAKYEGLHENQLRLLLKAHRWNEAHSVLIDNLAPEFFLKKNFQTLNDYLAQLSKENESINKWNLGGQVYLDAIKLNQHSQVLFDFSSDEQEKKVLDDAHTKEIHEQITVLSSRIKELKEFSCASPTKLLVCIQISKLLLNFLNVLIEMNNDAEMNQEANKTLTKRIVDKAFKLTNSVPSHSLIQTMLMKKTKYSRDFIMSRGGF